MTFLSQIITVLLGIVSDLGYFGIFIGMTLESSFFPFPSEVILIPAGVLVAQGKMGFIPVLIIAILGSMVGALINYFIAFSLGRKAIEKLVSKFGKVLFISKSELDRTDNYFKNHGQITTFVGRLLPGIRQLISLPAGFSKMHLYRFCLFTALGAGFWSIVLILTGWLAGKNQVWLQQHPIFVTILLIAFCVLIVATYIVFVKKRKTKKN